MKKIGLVLTRGMVTRNILRTEIFEKVFEKNSEVALIIFTPHTCVDSLKSELGENPRISVIGINPKKPSGTFRYRYLNVVLRNLVFTRSAEIVSFYGKTLRHKRNNLLYKTIFSTIGWLGKSNAIKKAIRFLEVWLFQEHWYDNVLFDNHVDLMILPDINGRTDSVIAKHCKRNGIATLGMTKGWDTVNQRLLPVLPDTLIVQNDSVYNDALVYQGMDPQTLLQTGFPQFDLYARRDWALPYEQFCATKNLNPNKITLLYGSSGVWSSSDEKLVSTILAWIESGAIPNAQLIIRPHFSDVTHRRYEHFKSNPAVFVDDYITLGPFIDEWNPGKKEMEDLANELLHAKVSITFASTLSLDGALMDIPMINIGFGAQFDHEGNDKTSLLYELTHYQPILQSNGVDLVQSEQELLEKIIEAINNKNKKSEERKNLRERMTRLSDGLAAQRIADGIQEKIK